MTLTTATEPQTHDQPRRSRGRARAAAVVGAWLALILLALPLAAGLESVQTDDALDFLPAGADSTRVAQLADSLPGGDEDQYLIVYVRDTGITTADENAAQGHLDALAALDDFARAEESRLQVSTDGQALWTGVPTSAATTNPEVATPGIREIVADRPDGLRAYVTGPSAMDADLDEVFSGIDETLMVATFLVVTLLLVLTYRSPVLWLLPLVAVGAATVLSMALVRLLVDAVGITVNTQSASILTVLVFGAGTDYALLYVARYREELGRTDDLGTAALRALRGAGPALLASAGTVVIALLCLLLADLNNIRGLGPVAAAGIVCALLAMTTLFPALLVLLGRRVFWPRIPVHDPDQLTPPRASRWDRLGAAIDRRRGVATLGSLAVLGALALGLLSPLPTLRDQDQFVTTPESVTGFVEISEHFPELGGQPMTILARPAHAEQVVRVAEETDGIVSARAGRASGEWVEISASPNAAPDSPEEQATILRLRERLDDVAGAEAIVGGPSAENLDQATTAARDERVVIPAILGTVLLVLCLLLRSLVAPILLVATVVASFAAAWGAGLLAFEHVLGFPGIDPSVLLLAFLFLVALGIDYNIFLMSRAREEAARHGTRAGILRALSTTGGVITSAGLVLAGTFAVLATLPLVMMIQLGFVVAFGVLLDTFLVRAVLVPALTLRFGDTMWAPGRLARPPAPEPERQPEAEQAPERPPVAVEEPT